MGSSVPEVISGVPKAPVVRSGVPEATSKMLPDTSQPPVDRQLLLGMSFLRVTTEGLIGARGCDVFSVHRLCNGQTEISCF